METPQATKAAPSPSSSTASPIINLLLRVLTFIFLFVSLIILTTNTATLSLDTGDIKFRFKDVYSYRYMLFTILIGIVYTLLQIAFTIHYVSTGKRLMGGNGIYQFDFYGDKVISYILATGAAATFGATVDLKPLFDGSGSSVDNFFKKGNASASLVLFGFLCSAASSIFSSLALPKYD